MKRIFRKLHLWLSVPFGIVMTLICFSGAMLVFEQEIVSRTHSRLFRVERPSADAQPLPLGQVATTVSATLPDGVRVAGIVVSPDPADALQVTLSQPRRAAVYVNPYTGEILGQYERPAFFRTMFSLHRWLLGSRPADGGVFWGKIVVGVSTLLFVVVLITGLIIWWPRTRKALKERLKISVRRGWPRFWHGLHAAGGIYALLFLLAMALTGLTWSFDWYRRGFYALFGVEAQSGGGHNTQAIPARDRQEGGKDKSRRPGSTFDQWQHVYEQLAAANPGYRQITVNADRTATVSTHRWGNTRGTDRYAYEPRSGQITGATPYRELPASGKIRGWIYSVHVGSWGGWATRILWFLSALLGATLPLTGYYLWIRRLTRRQVHR